MRSLMCAAGLFASLFALPGFARDDETYDLRGPAPQKGQLFHSSGSFTIKNGNSVIKLGGQTVRSKVTEKTISENEVKVLAVEGRQVTRCRTRIIKDITESKDDDGDTNTENSAIEGETIISDWSGPRKWKHALVDAKPTEKQKKKLDDLTGPDNDDALYPESKVKIGHTWMTDGSGLVNFFDASFTDIKGKLTMKFVKLEEIDGEQCAVIEATGTVTSKAKTDEGTLDMTMDLKRTVWRSLKTGVDLKDKTTGKLKFSGKLSIDGMDADYSLEGPFEAQGNTKVK
jgi:hypothetical protein